MLPGRALEAAQIGEHRQSAASGAKGAELDHAGDQELLGPSRHARKIGLKRSWALLCAIRPPRRSTLEDQDEASPLLSPWPGASAPPTPPPPVQTVALASRAPQAAPQLPLDVAHAHGTLGGFGEFTR
jgi:hypothetical protein